MEKFFVYAIYNKEKNKIYIGHTINLENRLKRHNGLLKNKNKSFTSKNSGVWEIIYNENLNARKEAILREKQLKSAKGREFVKSLIRI